MTEAVSTCSERRRGELAILVSHSTAQTAQGFQSFAIVLLNVAGSIVEVAGITRLNYQSVCTFPYPVYDWDGTAEHFFLNSQRPDPRPLSTPHLSLSSDETAFVVFADAVVIASLANGKASLPLPSEFLETDFGFCTDSPFEENFPLRHNTNRFIGASLPSISSSSSSSATTLSLLTSTASLLNLSVTPPAPLPLSVNNTSETYKTRKLKAKIEHAIYFGITSASSDKKKKSSQGAEEEENLFKFDLQRDYEGDLAVAVEGVSRDLLASGEFVLSFSSIFTEILILLGPVSFTEHAFDP